MIQEIEVKVTYIDYDELFPKCKNMNVEDIERHHVKDRNLIYNSYILIVHKQGCYKILKSRY